MRPTLRSCLIGSLFVVALRVTAARVEATDLMNRFPVPDAIIQSSLYQQCSSESTLEAGVPLKGVLTCLVQHQAPVTALALWAAILKSYADAHDLPDSTSSNLAFSMYAELREELTTPQLPSYVDKNPGTCEAQVLQGHPYIPAPFRSDTNADYGTLADLPIWAGTFDDLETNWSTYLNKNWPYGMALCYEARSDYHKEIDYLRLANNARRDLTPTPDHNQFSSAALDLHFTIAYRALGNKPMAVAHIRWAKQETGAENSTETNDIDVLYRALGQDVADQRALERQQAEWRAAQERARQDYRAAIVRYANQYQGAMRSIVLENGIPCHTSSLQTERATAIVWYFCDMIGRPRTAYAFVNGDLQFIYTP